LIGRADLLDDPRYRDHARRYAIIDEVEQVVRDWTAHRRRDEMIELLIEHGVPCAPVRSITEVAHDPELARRGLIRTGEFSPHGEVTVMGSAIKMAGAASDESRPRVPDLGEDTAAVLASLGLDAGAIAELRRDGVI
jgi:formyl-CoA transferase